MRQKGQSQLDYLWVNFGNYEVASVPGDGIILDSKGVDTLVNQLKEDSVGSLQIVGSQLRVYNTTGQQVQSLELPRSSSTGGTVEITNFGKRYVSQEDIAAGNPLPLNTPVYFLEFSNGSQLLAEIDSYSGVETNSIVIKVDNQNEISASLKINNTNTVVPIVATTKGVQADLKISNTEDSIQLEKTKEGLRARILLDNNNALKFKLLELDEYKASIKDLSTLYLIKDSNYLYFGDNAIGQIDNVYTKDEINTLLSGLVTTEELNSALANLGISWNII